MLFTCSSSRHPTSPSHFRSVACAHNLVSISSHHQKGLCKEFLSSFFWCNKQFSLLNNYYFLGVVFEAVVVFAFDFAAASLAALTASFTTFSGVGFGCVGCVFGTTFTVITVTVTASSAWKRPWHNPVTWRWWRSPPRWELRNLANSSRHSTSD